MGSWASCWAILRREFKLSNFMLDHQDPHLFLAAEWQRHPISSVRAWYVAYRWAWALYHVSWWAANFALEGGIDAPIQRKAYHFIYLTNWAYLSIAIMNMVHACIMTTSWLRYRRTAQLPKTVTTDLKVLWALQNLVFLPALLITSAYWTAIYDPVYPVTALNAEVHIINSVYVLVDLWVVASPLRILHFYIPLCFMIVYLVFTLIYWAVGGTTPDGKSAIYPIVDWDNLSVTLPFIICCGAFSPLMQVLFCWRGVGHLQRKGGGQTLLLLPPLRQGQPSPPGYHGCYPRP
ncbi:protein rolling stone isoform X2 [Cherax quadricarinatus]|uniref:protein rolling stone isoform X2 n=1 Tax=Cherax quadricarinatus TaxID=27406 RepID=UPI0023785AAC|nr:protein rolling stone-like isoform X2 [Cherax quadricarinatus]